MTNPQNQTLQSNNTQNSNPNAGLSALAPQTTPQPMQQTQQLPQQSAAQQAPQQAPVSLEAQQNKPKIDLPLATPQAQQEKTEKKERKFQFANSFFIFPALVIGAMAAGVGFSDYFNLDLFAEELTDVSNTAFASSALTIPETQNFLTISWVKVDNSFAEPSNTSSTNGRLTVGTEGTGDEGQILSSWVVFTDNEYRMWYSASQHEDGSEPAIFHATSSDGFTWRKVNNEYPARSNEESTEGRLAPGLEGAGDSAGVKDPVVVLNEGEYLMYYMGSLDGEVWRIYQASSLDGLTWTKTNNEIPEPSDDTSTEGRLALGTEGTGDSVSINETTILFDGTTYQMWYSAIGTDLDGITSTGIYNATSSDGLTWLKNDNSIIEPSDSISTNSLSVGTSEKQDTMMVRHPYVITNDANLTMLYVGIANGEEKTNNSAILCATSEDDGVSWTKLNNNYTRNYDTSTFCTLAPSSNSMNLGDSLNVYNPQIVLTSQEEIKLFYIGEGMIDGKIQKGVFTAIPRPEQVLEPPESTVNPNQTPVSL